MIRLLQFTLLILKSIFERNSVVTNRIKKNYRLLVNCKFSDHLSQFAYSLRKNNNAKLNNKKKITIRDKLRIIKYMLLSILSVRIC